MEPDRQVLDMSIRLSKSRSIQASVAVGATTAVQIAKCEIISGLLFLFLVNLPVLCAAQTTTTAGTASDLQDLKQSHSILETEALRLLDAVDLGVRDRVVTSETAARKEAQQDPKKYLGTVSQSSVPADIENTRQYLLGRVQEWSRAEAVYLETISAAEISKFLSEATAVAAAYGIDTDKMTKLYELGKKLIREGDFDLPNQLPPDKDESINQYFQDLFTFAHNREEAIAEYRAKNQAYRLNLFKKVTLAYMRALLLAGEPVKECTIDEPTMSAKLEGREVKLLGCPDPVVTELRNYVAAIHKIQSADSDTFLANAERVVAQQQLAADLLSVIPVVGDAVDLYILFANEDLSGRCLSRFEKGMIKVALLIPFVGPKVLDYALKKSPRLRGIVDKIYVFIENAMSYYQWYRGVGIRGVAKTGAANVSERLARQWGDSVPQLNSLAVSLKKAAGVVELDDAARAARILNETIEQAAHGARTISDLRRLAPEVYAEMVRDSSRVMRDNLLAVQPARFTVIKRSNMVYEHVEAIEQLVRREAVKGDKSILIYRAVNGDATDLIKKGFFTKEMNVKGKSADWGAHAGFIPLDQNLSKLANPAKKFGAKEASEVTKFNKKVKDFLDGLPPAERAKYKVNLEVDGLPVMLIKDKKTGKNMTAFFDEKTGRYLDKSRQPINPKSIDISNPKPVEVMAVPHPETGKPIPLTADYDLLAFGFQRPPDVDIPNYNPRTGYISEAQEAWLRKTNKAVQDAGYPKGANVSHHGPEVQFPFSPGALETDPRLLAIDPYFGPLEIPRCDARCMARWCATTKKCPIGVPVCLSPPKRPCLPVDQNRLLKDYFHNRRLDGYNLFPNKVWEWGHYNPMGGWTVNGFLDVPLSKNFVEALRRQSSRIAGVVVDGTRRNLMEGASYLFGCPTEQTAAEH